MKRWMLFLIAAFMALWPAMAMAAGGGGNDLPAAISEQTPLEIWQLLVAPLIAYAVQFAKKRNWDDEATRAFMVALSVVVAVGGSYFRGELDNWQFTTASFMVIAFSAHLSYKTIMQMSGLAGVTASIGAANDGPSESGQRAGFKGITSDTPPPGN